MLPGEYHILHKQATPLWYAPEQYFAARQMDVPAEGDRARYLRGALGEYAIYIDEKTPLHCTVWTEEIGGIGLSDESLARLFYLLDIGASVKC